MTIDRQRIEAVKRLQELGFEWDGTTWVSDASVGIMGVNTVPIAPQPAPAMPVQTPYTALDAASLALSRAISLCGHIVGAKIEVWLDRPVYNSVWAFMSTGTPTFINFTNNAFELNGVRFRTN